MNKGNLTEMANAEPYQLLMSKYFGLAGKWCSTLSCQSSISKQMIKVCTEKSIKQQQVHLN